MYIIQQVTQPKNPPTKKKPTLLPISFNAPQHTGRACEKKVNGRPSKKSSRTSGHGRGLLSTYRIIDIMLNKSLKAKFYFSGALVPYCAVFRHFILTSDRSIDVLLPGDLMDTFQIVELLARLNRF